MKKLVLLTTILFSTMTLAGNTPANVAWSDLELYKDYKLTEDIVFDNGMSFKAGEKFTMYDFIVGDEVPVIYYEMHQQNCTNPDATAEMVIVNVQVEGQDDVEIGAQLAPGCNLEIYAEAKDYYKLSNFAE